MGAVCYLLENKVEMDLIRKKRWVRHLEKLKLLAGNQFRYKAEGWRATSGG